MKIGIIGAGYVGLITGACLARNGNSVCLADVDAGKVAMINQCRAPLFEEGLTALLKNSVGRNLKATVDINETVADADVLFICVQTYCHENGAIDLTQVKQAITLVASVFRERNGYPVVVVKSTVVPGTTERIVLDVLEKISGKKAGRDFGVAVNPEFLKEGRAVNDFLNPDRIVIGELNEKSGDRLCHLYRDFKSRILRVDMKTAEMIKYASNAFLATKISYINEIGNICKKLGIDVYTVVKGMALDPRISPHFLNAGLGFGGSCLPKDTKALAMAARELGYPSLLLESVIRVNAEQPLKLVTLAEEKVGSLKRKKVAVLGLAFKPGTDDIREAPSLRIIKELLSREALVTVYDPVANGKARDILGNNISYAAGVKQAVADSELVFIVTEWDEFKDPGLYRGKKVFDGRKILDHNQCHEFCYEGICW